MFLLSFPFLRWMWVMNKCMNKQAKRRQLREDGSVQCIKQKNHKTDLYSLLHYDLLLAFSSLPCITLYEKCSTITETLSALFSPMWWYCFISWGCDFYPLSEPYKAFLNSNLRHPNWQPGALSCPFNIRLYIWKAFLLPSSCIKQSLVNVWSLEVLLCKNYFLLLVMLSDPIPCIIHVSHSESIRQTSGTQQNAYEFENGYGVIADMCGNLNSPTYLLFQEYVWVWFFTTLFIYVCLMLFIESSC